MKDNNPESGKETSKTYSIEARSYDIAGIASHNFWVLRDGKDRVISQLHGLATDRKTNQFKPIGVLNDRLGFYEFRTQNHDPSFIFNNQTSRIVFQGPKEDTLGRWNKASSHIDQLNDFDLNYSPFGIFGLPVTNSNSAYHLFAKLMAVECCRFPGVLEPGINNDLSYCSIARLN